MRWVLSGSRGFRPCAGTALPAGRCYAIWLPGAADMCVRGEIGGGSSRREEVEGVLSPVLATNAPPSA